MEYPIHAASPYLRAAAHLGTGNNKVRIHKRDTRRFMMTSFLSNPANDTVNRVSPQSQLHGGEGRVQILAENN